MTFETKKEHYCALVEDNKQDMKQLFVIANQLLHKSKDTILPPCNSSQELADKFVSYFTSKVKKIRDEFPVHNHQSVTEDRVSTKFSSFEEISQGDLEKIIKEGNSKCCSLDPLPTSFLKQLLPILLPTLTNIVNHL